MLSLPRVLMPSLYWARTARAASSATVDRIAHGLKLPYFRSKCISSNRRHCETRAHQIIRYTCDSDLIRGKPFSRSLCSSIHAKSSGHASQYHPKILPAGRIRANHTPCSMFWCSARSVMVPGLTMPFAGRGPGQS